MGKTVIILFLLILSSATVLSEELPSVSFTSFSCDDNGVLFFRTDYNWNGYKGGYVYLNSVKVNTISEDVMKRLGGYWYKFEDKRFSITEISLNSPTAYFFSKPGSLKEGSYEVTINYAISRSNLERFKNQFVSSVSCPKQKEVMKDVKKVVAVEKIVEEKEQPVATPAEPPLISKDTKNYVNYYIIGLLITIFIISSFVAGKFYKKHPEVKKKLSSKNVKSLFERKS